MLIYKKACPSDIALILHLSKSVICNEVNRLKHYGPDKAQADKQIKRNHCGIHSILNDHTESIIYNDSKLNYPLELIAHELSIATSSIYNWIYRHWITGISLNLLPEHGLRRKRERNHRGHFLIFLIKRLISERPTDVNLGIGKLIHTIMLPREKAKPCLVIFVERKTHLLWSMIAPI